LDHERTYDLALIDVAGTPDRNARRQPAWLTDGLRMTGLQLSSLGFSAPIMSPETSILLRLTSQDQ
jgi:hypothetical protein